MENASLVTLADLSALPVMSVSGSFDGWPLTIKGNSKMSEKSEVDSALAAFGMGILITFALGFAFFNAPGMIILYFVSQHLPPLALSQMWTFSIMISVVIFGLIILLTRNLSATAFVVFTIGAIIIGTLAIMKFGFLSAFPGDVLSKYGFT